MGRSRPGSLLAEVSGLWFRQSCRNPLARHRAFTHRHFMRARRWWLSLAVFRLRSSSDAAAATRPPRISTAAASTRVCADAGETSAPACGDGVQIEARRATTATRTAATVAPRRARSKMATRARRRARRASRSEGRLRRRQGRAGRDLRRRQHRRRRRMLGRSSVEAGFRCPTPASRASLPLLRRRHLLTPPEAATTATRMPGDGCSGTCHVEPNYTCPMPGKPCKSIDRLRRRQGHRRRSVRRRQQLGADGCAADCKKVETGYKCPKATDGTGGACAKAPSRRAATRGSIRRGLRRRQHLADRRLRRHVQGRTGYTCPRPAPSASSSRSAATPSSTSTSARAATTATRRARRRLQRAVHHRAQLRRARRRAALRVHRRLRRRQGREGRRDVRRRQQEGARRLQRLPARSRPAGSAPSRARLRAREVRRRHRAWAPRSATTAAPPHGDGCSSTCAIEPGYACTPKPATRPSAATAPRRAPSSATTATSDPTTAARRPARSIPSARPARGCAKSAATASSSRARPATTATPSAATDATARASSRPAAGIARPSPRSSPPPPIPIPLCDQLYAGTSFVVGGKTVLGNPDFESYGCGVPTTSLVKTLLGADGTPDFLSTTGQQPRAASSSRARPTGSPGTTTTRRTTVPVWLTAAARRSRSRSRASAPRPPSPTSTTATRSSRSTISASDAGSL